MSILKLGGLFVRKPEIIFRSLRISSSVAVPLSVCIVLQTIIAVIPESVIYSQLNLSLVFGVWVIIFLSYIVKTYCSAAFMVICFDILSTGGEKYQFRGIVSACIYCQFVLLAGKVAAVGVSVFRFEIGIADQFTVIRFLDLSFLFALFGYTLPVFIAKADIFTLLFLYYQSQYIRSVVSVSRGTAGSIALANWILLVLLQKTIIRLPIAL